MNGVRSSVLLVGAALALGCADQGPEASSTDGGSSGVSSSGGGTTGGGSAGSSAGASGGSGGTVGNGGTAAGSGGAGAGASGGVAAAGGGGLGPSGGFAGLAGSSDGGGGSAGSVAGAGPQAGAGSGGRAAGGAGAGGRGGAGNAGNAGAGGSPTGLPFKGVANSPCAARTALGVSWYYNWTQTASDTCATGGEFVPMIWGHAGAEQTGSSITSAVASFVTRGYQNVLAFNEPDNPSQSNIPVANAIALWPSFANASIKVGSPGTAANANPGQAWFTSFMTQLNANASLRADFLAIHWYGWNAGSCDASASQLESYVRWAEGFAGNRPIWITEWGCLNVSAPSVSTVASFYRGAIAMFARHPRIQRYAWYPWATNCALVNSDGSLTEIGTAYAAAPATR